MHGQAFYLLALFPFFLEHLQAAQELRGVWIARDSLGSKAEIAETMDRLAANNFNVVYVNAWSRGYPLWQSEVFKKHTGIAIDPAFTNRDVLAETIAEAHRVGIEVEAWFEYGFVGGFSGYLPGQGGKGPIFDAHPEWLAKTRNGSDAFPVPGGIFYWMAHTRPDVQKFLIDLAIEVVTKYDVDGIQFDRARYPQLDCGYDPYTVELYKSEHDGLPPPSNPNDAEWMRWRADKINAFVAALYHQVKAKRPNVTVSNAPAVFPFAYDNFLQDYPAWVNGGYLDVSTTQIYRTTAASYTSELDNQLRRLTQRERLYPGIAANVNNQNVPASEVTEMVRVTRARNLRGVVVWYYKPLLNIIASLKQTVFDEPAEVPYRSSSWKREVIFIDETSPDVSRSEGWERRTDKGWNGGYLLAAPGSEQTITYQATVTRSDWYEVYTHLVNAGNLGDSIHYRIPPKSTAAQGKDVSQRLSENLGWYKIGEVYLTAGERQQVLQINTRGQAAVADTVMLIRSNRKPDAASSTYRIPLGGGQTLQVGSLSEDPSSGHAVIQASAGTAPAALSLFSFRNGSVLVSEAGVPGIQEIRRANLIARFVGNSGTGVAISNPNETANEVLLTLLDKGGRNLATRSVLIPPSGQTSFFVKDLFALSGEFLGNIRIESDLPFGAVTLAVATNLRGDFLITSLPVFSGGTVRPVRYFPHFVDGGGFVTELILQNNSTMPMQGSIRIRGQDGSPLNLTINDNSASSFDYHLAPGATQVFKTSGTSSDPQSGSLMVQASSGSTAPDAVLLISFSSGNNLITQAGVLASQASRGFRGYYIRQSIGPSSGQGSLQKQTGIAIANVGSGDARVTVKLKADDAQRIISQAVLTIPAGGQTAQFLEEILSDIPPDFTGVFDLESDQDIAVTLLRVIRNERGDFLLSPLPLVDLSQSFSGEKLLIPHLVVGGPYLTEILLLSTNRDLSSGQILFKQPTGQDLAVTMF